MARIGEKIESRVVSQSPGSESIQLNYWVDGTSDQEEALDLAAATAPPNFGTLEFSHFTSQQTGPSTFDVSAHYAPIGQKPRQPGDSEFSFDVATTTVNRKQSLGTVLVKSADGWDPVAFQGGIEVQPDGSVNGVDVEVPHFAYDETHWVESLSAPYVGTLFALTGTVNNAPFKHFQAGEALFMGASARRASLDTPWRVTYRFRGAPNATSLTVGTIDGIDKQGWDHIWAFYSEAIEQGVKFEVPKQVQVERIYPRTNFALLGIGT